MADPIASGSRSYARSPSRSRIMRGTDAERSRSPSPARGSYAYPHRYNLPPLRSLGPDGSPPMHATQLPRLVLKTQPADSHSRGQPAGYSTLRSGAGSGSTSPADYVGGTAHGLGHGHAYGRYHGDVEPDMDDPGRRGRDRRYSAGSSGRSVSRSPSEASLPANPVESEDAQRRGDGDDSQRQNYEPYPREYAQGSRNGHGNGGANGHVSGQMWRDGDLARSTSASVSASAPSSARPGPILPPIPRTTKVAMAPISSRSDTPVRRQPPGHVGVSYNGKSRKSSCGLCHHRKIRVSTLARDCVYVLSTRTV
jgi:hypothetical protein